MSQHHSLLYKYKDICVPLCIHTLIKEETNYNFVGTMHVFHHSLESTLSGDNLTMKSETNMIHCQELKG